MSLTIRAWRTGARRGMVALLIALIAAGLITAPVLAAAPVANDQNDVTTANTDLPVFLDATDPEDDALTFAIVTNPSHGLLDDCTSGFCTYTPTSNYVGPDSFTWRANDGTSDSNTATFSITVEAGPVEITSAGPLTRVFVSNDLNCAVNHVDDTDPEFYGDTACATIVATGGTLYRPSGIPAGGSASPFTPFTPVGQSSVTGSGTGGDPYQIVTDVALGSTGLTISETDRYVVGQEVYRTDVTILNSSGTPQDAIVYRAGDCFLQNSDLGFGAADPASGAVSCVAGMDDGQGGTVPGTRIEQWYPLSAGSSYIEDFFDTVWGATGSQNALPNTCACDSYIDNGAGLSWNVSIPAGGSVTRSHLTVFSPLGIVPLTTEKTAAQPTAGPGAANSYTITIHNPNTTPAGLDSITDTLPAGFTYTVGSSSGATTTDPTIVASTLTWNGPFSVPASGSLSLTFGVTVSSTIGGYDNQAGAAGTSPFVVLGTGPTAHVTVSSASNAPPTSNAGGPYSGTEGSAISLDGTVTNEPGTDTVTQTWSYTLGAGTDAGMTCAFGNAGAIDTTITCTDDGSVTVKLTVSDGVNTPVEDSTSLTIANANPTVAITSPADGSTVNIGATVNVTASWGDAGSNDTHTCSIDWGDGTVTTGTLTATTCTGSHAYSSIGAPAIRVTIADDDGGSAFDEILLVVAEGGTKVTGGGWLVQGAGKLRFGFVAEPAGAGAEGEIQLRWGTHSFHGTTVTGLAAAKPTASWSGSGRYDGAAGYTYEVTVVDNGAGGGRNKTPDTFAIVIRDGSGTVVFSASGSLAGGNIKVH